MSQCYQKYDLNEKTCKFVAKCPDGKVRNSNFRCVNPPVNPQNAIKQRIQKGKLNAEERLRGRTEILKKLFKSKSDEWLKLEDNNIKEKLMRIKTQTVKRGFDDLTRNVNSLIGQVESYNGTRRRTRKPKKKTANVSLNNSPKPNRNSKEINLDDLDLNGVEDLRASSVRPSPENAAVNTPRLESVLEKNNSGTSINNDQVKKYAEDVSKYFQTINMNKLNLMLGKKTRTKKGTIKERRRPKGTSLNTKPRTKRVRANSPSP